MASSAHDARRTSTIANLSLAKTAVRASTRSADSRASAVAPATPEASAKRTSTSARGIRARTVACASTTTARTRASAALVLAATIAIKSSTSASRHHVCTAATALSRKKVTLSATVKKVLLGSFVKLHRNVPIVREIRNVWMVGVFVNTA